MMITLLYHKAGYYLLIIINLAAYHFTQIIFSSSGIVRLPSGIMSA